MREIYCSAVGSVIWLIVELLVRKHQDSWPIISYVKFVPEVSFVR